MSEPTLSLTFDGLILRVAEYLGVAPLSGGVPVIPTDAADLARCKRAVNDGYREVVSARAWASLQRSFAMNFRPALATGVVSTSAAGSPTIVCSEVSTSGTDPYAGCWLRIEGASGGASAAESSYITAYNSGTKTFTVSPALGATFDAGATVTVTYPSQPDGESHRHFLPGDFNGENNLQLVAGDSLDTVIVASQVDEHAVRQMHQLYSDNTADFPTMYAVRHYGGLPDTRPRELTPPLTDTDITGRWEIIYWPKVGASVPVTGRYRAIPAALSAGTDRHAMGPANDELILAAALAQAERQFNDGGDGRMERAFAIAMMKAERQENRLRPRNLGQIRDDSDGTVLPPRPYHGVETYNGNPV